MKRSPERDTPLSPERQKLVETAKETVEDLAESQARRWGRKWHPDFLSWGWKGAFDAGQTYDLRSDTPYLGYAWSRIFNEMRAGRLREMKHSSREIPAGEAALACAGEQRDAGDIWTDSPEEQRDQVRHAFGGVAAAYCAGYTGTDPETAALRAELLGKVGQMNERDRTMIEERFFKEVPMTELALRLGIGESTAWTHLQGAMKRLAKLITEDAANVSTSG